MPDDLAELTKILKKVYSQQTLLQSFLRGIAQGLGSVIGATVVVALLFYMVSNVQLIPIIGNWLAALVSQVQLNLMYR